MFLSKDLIIRGYKKGIFPMSESSDDPFIFWVSPEKRGIIEVDEFIVPKSLKKFIRKKKYSVKVNTNFSKVIKLCAKITKKREETWINNQIIENYIKLHTEGFASSFECYYNDELVGGLYGVKIGRIFFGESMFSIKDNASKVALVHLVAYLKQGQFKFIDTQFITSHLRQFGAKEVPKNKYINILKRNISQKKNIPLKLNRDILEYFN